MRNLDKYLSLLNEEVDGLLLTSEYSRFYGAEYAISEGVAIVTRKGCRYFTDMRYIEAAQKGIRGFEVIEMNRQNPFNDLLNNFERVCAHCSNIAITILESQDSHLKAHDYVGTLDRSDQNTYELQLQFYRNKYLDNIGKI